MKTLVLSIAILIYISNQLRAQADLAFQMGIHHGSRIYETGRGTHLGLQYQFPSDYALSYGVGVHSSSFNSDFSQDGLTQITSLTGFASYRLFAASWAQPYLKLEVGAAHNLSRGGLEQRYSSYELKNNRFSAQIAPALGTRVKLIGPFALRLEYRHIVHYGSTLVKDGRFNYGSLDFGLNYVIGQGKCRNGCPVW